MAMRIWPSVVSSQGRPDPVRMRTSP